MSRVSVRKWMLFLAFAAVWLALRVFWLDGDSGIPSFWEYGYHVTDEGYYLSGGKELYLWGSAVDLDRGECLTYGYAAGMQWLSYIAHRLFGLSTWAWRIPFFAIYFLAALLGYRHVERRSGTCFAFPVCVTTAILPLMVVYERTASNDTLMAALVVISYAVAFGKGIWRIPAAALIVSFLILIKPAVWALLPIPLSAVLSDRKTRTAWLDAVLFVGLAVVFAFGWKALAAWTVADEASALGMTSWQVLGKLKANYGLPDFLNLANDFKAFAAYPRDPSYCLLGPVALFLTAFPIAFFVRQLMRRKWNAHLLIYLSVPAYVGAASVMNTLYTHYFIPMIALLPILLSAVREDLAEEASDTVSDRRALIVDLLGVLLLSGAAVYFVALSVEQPAVIQKFYSRVYNLPAENPWGGTAVFLIFGTLAASAFVALRSWKRTFRTDWPAVVLGLFVVLSVTFAVYPALHLAPVLRLDAGRYMAPFVINALAGGLLTFALFLHPEILRKRLSCAVGFLALVALAYVATPTWRLAAVELLRPATHVHAAVAAELAKLVPENAVVIGERTDQAFISLPVRTAATFISNSDPTPVIEALWKRDPNMPLFAFADSQHAYNLQHYQKHQQEFQLQLVKTFKMPSFATGRPADVHLCRIIDRRPRSK